MGYHKPNKRDKCKNVKFVKAKPGIPRGNGSKKCPWTTLSQAQEDTTWKTLVVLHSDFPLDGGLSMRPGTQLLGKSNKCGQKPIITNTTPSEEDSVGNGVFASGSVCIKNIWFKDTQKSGIQVKVSDKARTNLSICDVLITGHNQSNSIFYTEGIVEPTFVPPPGISQNFNVPFNGILIVCNGSGNTKIKNVTIKENFTGGGFNSLVYGGAKRNSSLKKLVFTKLQNSTPASAGIINNVSGVAFTSDGANTVVNAKVTCSKFTDVITNVVGLGVNVPIPFAAFAHNGGVLNFSTDSNQVVDWSQTVTVPNAIKGAAFTWAANYNPDFAPGSPRSVLNLKSYNNNFVETVTNQFFNGIGQDLEFNGDINLDFRYNKFENYQNGMELNSFNGANRKINFTGNKLSGRQNSLFRSRWFGVSNPASEDITLLSNYMSGARPSLFTGEFQTQNVTVNLNGRNNCILTEGEDPISATVKMILLDGSAGVTPTLTFNLRNNNLKYEELVTRFNGIITGDFNLQNNYWFGPVPPSNAPGSTIITSPELTSQIPGLCDCL